MANAASLTPATSAQTLPSTASVPKDIIHSAPQRRGAADAPTLVDDDAEYPSSPKTRLFGIFSPRASQLEKSPTALRRIFSPPAERKSVPRIDAALPRADDADTDDSSTTPTALDATPPANTSRRVRFMSQLCSCFVAATRASDSMHEFEYGQHLKTLEPTYEPSSPLLPTRAPQAADRICLVLDLDETLVHSSFTEIPGADFEIPLEMQGETHTVYVKKRPGVDEFLKRVSEWYEIVVFTASLALYANPVMDLLDPQNLVQLRLYREHCVLVGGCYVKDIAKLGRDLKRTFIIDNSPLSYVLQPENAIPITAFYTDENDRELEKTLALLERAKHMKDVRKAFS